MSVHLRDRNRSWMTARVRAHPERIRLFRSDLLERTTVLSPRVFLAIWSCVLMLVAYMAWGKADWPTSAGLVAVGVVGWSLFEYVMHRFLFHLRMRSKAGQYVIFVMHGNHHAEPNDPDRNMMPPIISLPWSAAIWAVFALLLGGKGTLLFLGFAIGYVAYDSIHYACHQLPMRGRLLNRLRKHHLRHHYAKREGNFAITTILWDRLFGTDIPAKKR
jgi:sterol desaturase/sphingolipid hydroxylase (fatty acid hydroxylase superfamily)